MNRLSRAAAKSFDTFRSFRNPLFTALTGAGVFKPAFCSYDVERDGRKYRVLARPIGGDHSVLREVLVRDAYAPVLPLLEDKPLRVLDVGAHIGCFMVWLTENRQVEQAYCFEPELESFNLCRFNLAQRPNCEVVRLALGGKTRRETIWIDPGAHSRSTIVKGMERSTNTESLEIDVLSFAEWMSAHPGNFDLLKMDCEGAEWEILRSCPEVFARFTAIVAELHADPVEHRTHSDFADAIRKIGFETHFENRFLLAKRLADSKTPAKG
jgi:FkbM family methyltransferase